MATSNAPYQILLVEDNLINQRLLARQLSRAGCEVTTADDGQYALDVLLAAAKSGRSFHICGAFACHPRARLLTRLQQWMWRCRECACPLDLNCKPHADALTAQRPRSDSAGTTARSGRPAAWSLTYIGRLCECARRAAGSYAGFRDGELCSLSLGELYHSIRRRLRYRSRSSLPHCSKKSKRSSLCRRDRFPIH